MRQSNDDSVVACIDTGDGDSPFGVIAVADGVGGARDGASASQSAIAAIRSAVRTSSFRRETDRSPAAATSSAAAALTHVLSAVVADAQAALGAHAGAAGGGYDTTLTVVVVRAGVMAFAHLGDSRAYLLRDGALTRLTEDHTVAQSLVAAGTLAVADAPFHRGGDALTRYLSGRQVFAPECGYLPVRDGDLLVVCSDGLHRMVPDDRLRTACSHPHIRSQSDLDALALGLVAMANAAGGPDNISVALAVVRA